VSKATRSGAHSLVELPDGHLQRLEIRPIEGIFGPAPRHHAQDLLVRGIRIRPRASLPFIFFGRLQRGPQRPGAHAGRGPDGRAVGGCRGEIRAASFDGFDDLCRKRRVGKLSSLSSLRGRVSKKQCMKDPSAPSSPPFMSGKKETDGQRKVFLWRGNYLSRSLGKGLSSLHRVVAYCGAIAAFSVPTAKPRPSSTLG